MTQLSTTSMKKFTLICLSHFYFVILLPETKSISKWYRWVREPVLSKTTQVIWCLISIFNSTCSKQNTWFPPAILSPTIYSPSPPPQKTQLLSPAFLHLSNRHYTIYLVAQALSLTSLTRCPLHQQQSLSLYLKHVLNPSILSPVPPTASVQAVTTAS